jgi:5-keto 4-deoxyuronate isomerase
MKTPPTRLAFIVLAVVAILAFLACSQRLWFGKDTFVLNIGSKGVFGVGKKYVDVKSQDDLDSALNALSDQAQYDIDFLSHEGATPIPHYTPRPHTSLKTNRVIRSDVAQQTLAEESAVNDPHVTYRVQSSNPADIKTVLNAFK